MSKIVVAEASAVLTIDDSGYRRGLERADKALEKWASDAERKGTAAAGRISAALGRIDTGKLNQLGDRLTLGVTVPLIAAGGAALKFASDTEESLNKVRAVFGDSARSVEAWSAASVGSLKMSRQEALEAAGTFGNLLTSSMGFTNEEAAKMSQRLVKLGADLGSFNNVKSDEALLALRAALVGESEPMRRFGANLSVAKVEARALEMGLAATKDELTDNARARAAYNLLLEQTRNAHGDIERSGNALAGQQRDLAATLRDQAAILGQELMPVALEAIGIGKEMLKGWQSLSPEVRENTLRIALFAAAAGPVIKVLAGVVDGVKLVISLRNAAVAAWTAKTIAIAANTKALDANTLAAARNAGAALGGGPVSGGGGLLGAGRGLLGRVGGLAGRIALPVGIGLAGIGAANWLNDVADQRQGRTTPGDWWKFLNPWHKEDARIGQAGALETLDQLRARSGGMSPREKLLAAQGLTPGGAPSAGPAARGTADELAKAMDARRAAEIEAARNTAAAAPDETRRRTEAARLVPILEKQAADLRKRAGELQPLIAKSAKSESEYWETVREQRQVQGQIEELKRGAAKEAADATKKAAEQARETTAAFFQAAREQAQAWAASAAPGEGARDTADAMSPIILSQLRDVAARAAQATAGSREYADLSAEYWKLRGELNQINAAAAGEEEQAIKKAQEDAKSAAEAASQAQLEAGRAWAELAKEGEQDRAAALALTPALKEEQARILREIQTVKPMTAEFFRLKADYWKTEKQVRDLTAAAAVEEKEQAKQAVDAAKKAAAEKRDVAGLRTSLARAQLALNPFLSERMKKAALVPALTAQFRAEMTPVEGETEQERLQRLIQAHGTAGSVVESALGGRRNPVAAARILQRLGMIGDDAARSRAPLAAMGGRGGTSNLNVTVHLDGGQVLKDPTFQRDLEAFLQWRIRNNRGAVGAPLVPGF